MFFLSSLFSALIQITIHSTLKMAQSTIRPCIDLISNRFTLPKIEVDYEQFIKNNRYVDYNGYVVVKNYPLVQIEEPDAKDDSIWQVTFYRGDYHNEEGPAAVLVSDPNNCRKRLVMYLGELVTLADELYFLDGIRCMAEDETELPREIRRWLRNPLEYMMDHWNRSYERLLDKLLEMDRVTPHRELDIAISKVRNALEKEARRKATRKPKHNA